MSMEDIKALTECAECTWDYIDRLRMALAAACKERDELKKRLAAYEDTGLTPEEIERVVDAYGRGHTLRTESAERLEIVREIKTDRLRELAKAEKDGRLVVLDEKTALCMCAGARAIENNKRLFGASYCYDVFGKRGGPKEISYYEASNHLRDVAEPVLDREEAEAVLKGGESDA